MLSTLHNCEIFTYEQMAQVGLMAPLFLGDYLAQRGRRALRRLRGADG